MNKKEKQAKPSGKKMFLFNTLLFIVFPVIILFLVEISLRIFHYGDDYRLFMDFPGKEVRQHRIINPVIGKKYFQKLEYTRPCHDMFLKEKPENGFRIFVLGSSTVLGFPYDENLMFTRILQERLQDSYPDRQLEVVNTAFTAINSFTLLDFIDDILKEEPDAILIYAGQNEFYGALGLGSVEKVSAGRGLTLLHLNLLSFRLYQALRNAIQGLAALAGGNEKKSGVRGTLMKVIAENKEIPYKGGLYNKTVRRYEKNMDRLLKKAKHNEVAVFISELVSNVRDIRPFCSSSAADYPAAEEVYQQAVQHEKAGDYANAREQYDRAKDLDCIRFRASDEINAVITRLAGKHGATIVPMKTGFFGAVSPNGIIGNNLMTEHVHPNIDGYFLMADAFFYSIAESNVLGEKLNTLYFKNSAYYRNNWGFTELDSLLGVHRVNALKFYWPYQPYDSPFIDYREIYKPTSKMDSLAFDIIRLPDYRTNEAHLAMAEYYKKHNDCFNAFREYHAAIRCNPFQVKDYLDAVDCLIKIRDIPLALEFIDQSLDLQPTFNCYFRKGELMMLKGDYAASIAAFNSARTLDTLNKNKSLVLSKLYEAYSLNGDEKMSATTMDALKNTDPGYIVKKPEKRFDYIFYVPVQVEGMIREAIALYKEGNDSAALGLLLKSLDIRETSLANRIAGSVLMKKNDRNAILHYLRAYPDYKNDMDFLYELGVLYLQRGADNKAKEILNEMKKLDRKNEKTGLLEESIVEHRQ